MNCIDFERTVDDYLDGQLSRDEEQAVERHAAGCDHCAEVLAQVQTLMRDLHALQVPAASPGFAERALAAASGPKPPLYRRWAAAASIALLVTGIWAGLMLGQQTSDPLEGITLALHEERTVNLAFNVPGPIHGGTLIMELPAGVELAGYPDQRQLRWQADLQEGTNLLSLPMKALSGRGGELVARIEHGGKSKSFRLHLEVQAANHSGWLTPAQLI